MSKSTSLLLLGSMLLVMLVAAGTSVLLLYYPVQSASGPRACTMEAMQCPDGKTYVGRTGPNCEFSTCPTSDGKIEQNAEALCRATGGVYQTCPACPKPGLCAPCPGPCRCAEGKFLNIEKGCISTTSPNASTSFAHAPSADTSGWKTYRNEEYGFEVRYPESFATRFDYQTNTMQSYDESRFNELLFEALSEQQENEGDGGIRIKIGGGRDLQTYIREYDRVYRQPVEGGMHVSRSTNAAADGREAIWRTISALSTHNVGELLISLSSTRVLQIEMFCLCDIEELNTKIISTFKFTK